MLSIHGRTAKQMSKVPADWDLIGQAVELRNAMFPLRQRPLHADGVQGAGEQQTEVYGLYSEGEAQPVTPQSAASASGAASSAGRQAGAVQRPLIVGNGDVASRAQAEALAEKYNLDGIMIGRGIFHDPFLFAKDSPWEQWSKQQKLDLFAKHIELYLKTYKDGERRFEALRKFCKVYINGFDGASDLRAKFMETSTPEQALDLLR